MEAYGTDEKTRTENLQNMRISSNSEALGLSVLRKPEFLKGTHSNGFMDSKTDVLGEIEKCCSNESWIGFTETTSLHGLRYIWLKDTFTVRRLFWLVLVLACVGLMSYQIVDRIVYYYRWPVNVNMQVNYNKTLEFPTVTICNENVFRATAAAWSGDYQLISHMFGDVTSFSSSDLSQYNASHVTYESLVRSSAHKREDLIVKCQWRGESCGPNNFSEVLTDHGLCYMFNGQYDSLDLPFYAYAAGSENGLSLTLNIEQYEYMPGPHDAAGVKVLIHDGRQFPKVHELGIAFPTGSHSFVGIKLVSVTNLPSPHGKCRSQALKYFPDYSLENCEVECVTDLLEKTCGCRRFYMPPHPTDQPPVCTLEEIYTCYKNNIDDIKASVHESCGCAIPCQFHIFEPTVSYATTSMLIVDRFLAQSNRTDLRQKYQLARDVSGRLQKEKAEEMQSLIDSVETTFTKLEQLISVDISSKLKEQEAAINKMTKETFDMWFTMHRLFRYQHYIVQKNCLRARDAMDERTFSVLGLGIQEFVFSVEQKIALLVSSKYDDSVREVLYLMTLNQLDARIDIAERTMGNYTQLYNAYMNGECIFNYKFLNFARRLSTYIIPRHLLSSAMNRTKTIKYRSERLGYDIANMTMFLKEYKRIAHDAFVNRTVLDAEMHELNVQFLYFTREYFQSRSMFFHDMLDWPMKYMEKREMDFLKAKSDFDQSRGIFTANLHSVKTLLVQMQYSLLEEVKQGIRLCKDYINTGNVSKLAVAKYINMKSISDGIFNLSVFFDTVRRKGQDLYDGWKRIRTIILKMWKTTVSDVDMKSFLEHQNMTLLLRSYDDIEVAISGEIDVYRNELDLRFLVHSADSEFIAAFEILKDYMKDFVDSSHVDSTFIRNNFLRLDIFYRELNYEQITQQEAYGVFGLLCDIGGSMGLFVGASVMTIFEIIDLIAYHTTVGIRHRPAS
ncbi:uncharacterized protein LOC121389619 [Gigantopelta aegis]|uniref:uncharacterized protein LOC121389619 n=1 Tax=Gigantopelta aegis TaxID=1735272 RepID=UPI001B888723|nr:uncharacterized protein LOC121389619 [Gigantopelta aegis]